jgi:diguanylate cyclase (GGDEF)-like protein
MNSLIPKRAAWLIAAPVLLIALAVFVTANVERSAAIQSGRQQAASARLLTAMLEQETGAQGYLQTNDRGFLTTWTEGTKEFASQLAASRTLAGGDPLLVRSLNEQANIAATWHASTLAAVNRFASLGIRPSHAEAVDGRTIMQAFRASNATFESELQKRGDDSLEQARWLTVEVAAGLAVLLTLGAMFLLRRISHTEAERLHGQSNLRELLQASQSEQEARTLLVRHVERIIPGSAAAVLNRNNSDDKLEPLLSARAEETAMKDITDEAISPHECLAVRLSHAHERTPGDDSLVECAVCGKIGANIACEPLLVGGQVIGSVLVAQTKKIKEAQRQGVRDAVIQAAPILANQRNLALAERRATSDQLTGLPNRRAADDALRRMAAHASRAASPLAAVLLDLDHFKQINDIHGHDAGDEVLATIGQLLTQSLRTSDFAARYGGEEFLLLLPDTDRDGAVTLAEKLRRTIEQADYARMASVTGSFGVAFLPGDATEVEHLIREADRALYRAKARGRNRVEGASAGDLDIATPIPVDVGVIGSPIEHRTTAFPREMIGPLGTNRDRGDFWPTLPA